MLRDAGYVEFVTTVLAELAKPWCVFILPASQLEAFVMSGLAPLLNAQSFGFAFFAQPYPARAARSSTFPLPASAEEWFSVVGIVRAAPPPLVDMLLGQHRALFEDVLARGGTIYPYGSIPLSPADWPRILGDRWPAYQALKRTYDPSGILNPGYAIAT